MCGARNGGRGPHTVRADPLSGPPGGAGPLRVPWGAGVVRPPAVRPRRRTRRGQKCRQRRAGQEHPAKRPAGPAAVQHGHESLLLAHFSRRPALNQTGLRADHHDYRSGTATSVTRRQGPPHRWLPGRAPAELPGRDCPIRAGPPVQVSPGDRVDHLPAESHVAADGNSVKASARGVRLVCGRRRPPAQLGDRWTSERVFTTLPAITPLPPLRGARPGGRGSLLAVVRTAVATGRRDGITCSAFRGATPTWDPRSPHLAPPHSTTSQWALDSAPSDSGSPG